MRPGRKGIRNGGANPVRPNSILPPEFSSDTLDELGRSARRPSGWTTACASTSRPTTWSWDDFAVQIEDPQPGVFQLGYVNLPTAEIEGVEAEFTFVVNDAWQIDATLGYNDAQISEATRSSRSSTTTATSSRGPVEDGARLPLTPDWSGALGIEWRPRGKLLNAQPFARVDLAYVGEVVTNLEGFESVVGQAGVAPRMPTRPATSASGSKARAWSGSFFVDNIWDERAMTFRSNRWAEPRQSIIRPRTYGLQFRYDF